MAKIKNTKRVKAFVCLEKWLEKDPNHEVTLKELSKAVMGYADKSYQKKIKGLMRSTMDFARNYKGVTIYPCRQDNRIYGYKLISQLDNADNRRQFETNLIRRLRTRKNLNNRMEKEITIIREVKYLPENRLKELPLLVEQEV